VSETVTVTRPDFPPAVLDLGASTPSAVSGALDGSQVPSELRRALDGSLGSQRLSLFDATITPIETDERSRLAYRLGMKIRIDTAGRTLTLEAEDGTRLGAWPRPAGLLDALVADLDARRPDGVLKAFVGELAGRRCRSTTQVNAGRLSVIFATRS
jgi:hypothetical protein